MADDEFDLGAEAEALELILASPGIEAIGRDKCIHASLSLVHRAGKAAGRREMREEAAEKAARRPGGRSALDDSPVGRARVATARRIRRIPIGDETIEISNKGCRLAYGKAQCQCPEGRCWVELARRTQATGLPVLDYPEWLRAIEDEDEHPDEGRDNKHHG